MSVEADQGLEVGQPVAAAALDHSSQLRFLLIEDSTPDSELVRALLEDEFPNGAVDVATSLELALHRLAETDYDLILADLTLPDADGEMVVSAVRAAFPQTALMVLTGRADGTLALWTLAEGAQDYLVKGEHDGPRLAEALLRGLQRNRTEQRAQARMMAALRLESEAVEQLRALDSAKTDFVATASHELRTPLASIVAYAEMLQDEVDLTARQEKFVSAIVRNAARLSALTDDLLLLSGLNSPQLHIETPEVDLRTVVSSAVELLAPLTAGTHLEVSVELPRHPALLAGDAGQLERVVLNLMSNAIKFTEDQGTVICRVSCTPTDVYMAVIDNGIGVPEAEVDQLFNKFFRGTGARDRATRGTGLGLHIASSIVNNHGGDISVESIAGQGTTFTVRLPRQRSDPPVS